MKYNLDEVIDRSTNHSSKYDEGVKGSGAADMILLWVADMDFRTAQLIIDACKEKAEEGIWGYTSRSASYFEAMQQWGKKRNDWDVDTTLVSWSLGVVPTMSAMIKIFSEEGDKIPIQTPMYSEFYGITEAWSREVVENRLVERDGTWAIDFEDFEAKAKECRIFLLCDPYNPLGIVWNPRDLKRMAGICMANNVLLVSGEVYSDLILHGRKHTPTTTLSEGIEKNIITCVFLTKTFNLAGLQAPTTIFPNQELRQAFDKFWANMDIHGNNAFSFVAMGAAYREGEEWLEQVLKYISGNFDFIKSYCETNIPKIRPNLPDATCLVWLDCQELDMDNEELRRFVIEKARVGSNEGYTFGQSLSGFMRLNTACPRATLKRVLKQLKDAVDAL